MSRQLEQQIEEANGRRNSKVLWAIYGGLAKAVNRAGGELTGITVKLDSGSVLVVLKAAFPGGAQVGFVGGENLADALIKAEREARTDKVHWRADKWA